MLVFCDGDRPSFCKKVLSKMADKKNPFLLFSFWDLWGTRRIRMGVRLGGGEEEKEEEEGQIEMHHRHAISEPLH